MWADWVWMNGRLMRGEEASVSVFDRSFLLGDGLFETMRAVDGRLFRLDQHLARLEQSARRLRLVLPVPIEEISAAIRATLAANQLRDAAVRLTVSRGVGPPGPGIAGADRPLWVIAARPFDGYPDHWYSPGARAITSVWIRNERSPLAGTKTTSYLEHVLARAEAAERGADEALLVNTHGRLVEGSSSNLFVVVAGCVYTPDLASGCLPGVTRAAVIEVLNEASGEVREEALLPEALAAAEEAFLTNCLLGVAPLASVDGRRIGLECPGAVTIRAAERYRQLVDREAK